jgi:hypothetical protein
MNKIKSFFSLAMSLSIISTSSMFCINTKADYAEPIPDYRGPEDFCDEVFVALKKTENSLFMLGSKSWPKIAVCSIFPRKLGTHIIFNGRTYSSVYDQSKRRFLWSTGLAKTEYISTYAWRELKINGRQCYTPGPCHMGTDYEFAAIDEREGRWATIKGNPEGVDIVPRCEGVSLITRESPRTDWADEQNYFHTSVKASEKPGCYTWTLKERVLSDDTQQMGLHRHCVRVDGYDLPMPDGNDCLEVNAVHKTGEPPQTAGEIFGPESADPAKIAEAEQEWLKELDADKTRQEAAARKSQFKDEIIKPNFQLIRLHEEAISQLPELPQLRSVPPELQKVFTKGIKFTHYAFLEEPKSRPCAPPSGHLVFAVCQAGEEPVVYELASKGKKPFSITIGTKRYQAINKFSSVFELQPHKSIRHH